jgi:hypothetical protein
MPVETYFQTVAVEILTLLGDRDTSRAALNPASWYYISESV